jgi:hypothetical protein
MAEKIVVTNMEQARRTFGWLSNDAKGQVGGQRHRVYTPPHNHCVWAR